MAAVEQPFQSVDPQVERDRERDSAAAKFTTVNGNPGSTKSPQTSFRPDATVQSETYHQHSPPGQAAPPEQTHQPPHKPNEKEWSRLSPAPEFRHHIHLGKRKRSLESPPRRLPENLSGLIRSSSPAAINPIAGKESPSRNLPPLLAYARYEHPHSRDHTRRQQQTLSRNAEIQSVNLPRRDSHVYQVRGDHFEGSDGGQLQTGPHSDSSTKKQEEPRKRKFSQRTKNGCHTCRGRKKKCDEGTPFCQNCIRGNFPCQGYGPKNELDVKIQSKSIPLQSKSSADYAPGYYQSAPGAPTEQWLEGQSRYPPENQYRARLFDSGSRYGQRDGLRTMEPPEYEKPFTREGFGRASVSEATRAPPPSRFSMMALSGPYTENGSSSRGNSIGGMANDTRAGQLTSRPSMSNYPPPRMVDTTEKENMLAGRLYRHFLDPHLMDERAWCAEALERFNNAARPSSGIDRDERARLFCKIIKPPRLIDAADPRFPIGSIGSQALVEAPFQCMYGYNINIGEDVVIQAGCIMQDPCRITIGMKTIVCINVRFHGLGLSLDPRVRNGCHGQSRGGPITIEEDCYIGGDVSIHPNVIIGRGAVVEAGTVVSENVQPNTVVAGNPMRKVRDIGPAPDEEYNAQFRTDSSMGGPWPDRFGNRLLGN